MVKNTDILYSLFLFVIAGICEIGGGYLIWLWIRENYSWIVGMFGGFILFLYGIIPTLQKSHFHRIYAAYGGIFIVIALFWGYFFEQIIPDFFDIIGAIITSLGVIIIFYFPRKEGERIDINSSP